MREQTKVDWTKAPEGATHYNLHNNKFYKASDEICYIYLQDGWKESPFDLGEIQEGDYFIPRPVETKKVEQDGYELADGTFHLDYKIGDTFKVINEDDDFPEGTIITLCGNDANFSKTGYFSCGNDEQIIYWRNLVATNKASPKTPFEWKIKHIKADDYKCGRDVALTILYKDIGDGYYEYKYSICNKTDMFSRKKGVEVALSKPDTWKVYVGNYNKVIEPIIYHIALSTRVSKDFVNLVVGQGFFSP